MRSVYTGIGPLTQVKSMATLAGTQHIVATPNVAGGKPRIDGHRITVQNVVIWHERLGMSVDTIAAEYDLTPAQVHAALAFYFDHRVEIDQSIAADRDFTGALQQQTPSKLSDRLLQAARTDD